VQPPNPEDIHYQFSKKATPKKSLLRQVSGSSLSLVIGPGRGYLALCCPQKYEQIQSQGLRMVAELAIFCRPSLCVWCAKSVGQFVRGGEDDRKM